MRFGGLQIFLQKMGEGGFNFLGITRKTIVIIMILTKEVKNFLGHLISNQNTEVWRLLLEKLSHWT